MAQKFRAWFSEEMYDEPVVYDGCFYLDWRDFIDGATCEDAILMQSTGIFDENGVEIFDGDILLVENNANGVTWKEVVFYDKEKALFASKEVDLHELEQELYNLLNTTFLKVSVVGNIYENPELLEGSSCKN